MENLSHVSILWLSLSLAVPFNNLITCEIHYITYSHYTQGRYLGAPKPGVGFGGYLRAPPNTLPRGSPKEPEPWSTDLAPHHSSCRWCWEGPQQSGPPAPYIHGELELDSSWEEAVLVQSKHNRFPARPSWLGSNFQHFQLFPPPARTLWKLFLMAHEKIKDRPNSDVFSRYVLIDRQYAA